MYTPPPMSGVEPGERVVPVGSAAVLRPGTRLRLQLHRLRSACRQAVSRAEERDDFRQFQQFHEGLADREDVIFMFFTADLLHWLRRALEFVPAEANVVLIGSRLSAEEIAWIATHTRRPFHHIESRVDDNTVLDFIFRTTRHNFGWLHIDCFVLNPAIFQEMATIADDVVANCIWSHPATGAVNALHSAFVFLNFKVMQAVRQSGIEVSPLAYHYQGGHLGRTMSDRKLYSRVPTARQVELLARVLPPGESGLPKYPQGGSYFQLLVLYQLVANALGYKLHHVRELLRDGTGSPSSYSNEIIHVNGVATYKSSKETDPTIGGRFYSLLLQADYHMLSLMAADAMPPRYTALLAELRRELARLGIPEEQTKRNLYGFLIQSGISEEKCREILGLSS
jgi:hypothetical protein